MLVPEYYLSLWGTLTFQAHLKTLNEQAHIEIEERYGELLKTDRTLRSLQLKLSPFLSPAVSLVLKITDIQVPTYLVGGNLCLLSV